MIIDEDKAMQALNGLLNPFITQNGAQPLDPARPQSPDVTPEIPTQEPPADEPAPSPDPVPTETGTLRALAPPTQKSTTSSATTYSPTTFTTP